MDILWLGETNWWRIHTIKENCGTLNVCEIPSQIQDCQDADRTELS